MQYVYHAVTERPMTLGQQIIFDAEHHNGVYGRVMTFKRIVIDGEEVDGPLAELINSDRKRWGEVAYRELALEQIRRESYPQYPSRMSCLYTSHTFEEAVNWAKFFNEIGRKVFSVVKLRVEGNVFDGDATLCFDGVGDPDVDLPLARTYWAKPETERPVIETLVDGVLTVEEVIDFKDL